MGGRIRPDDGWRKVRRENDSPRTVRRIAATRLPTHNSEDEQDGVEALDFMGRIYRNLHGVSAAMDAIVVSRRDVEGYENNHALVIKPALQDRKVVYEAA
ncbi:MAG: hypothetical protein F4Z65_13055 [Acidobacteria bacterium]|nr:hypothetical protein [Acidobacteriota bacterium]MYA47429.1 hypothetical protein [Acidobacteriota bacterium]MYI39803.1 hypothetical protein [Acidobacteriota bacterium]